MHGAGVQPVGTVHFRNNFESLVERFFAHLLLAICRTPPEFRAAGEVVTDMRERISRLT